MNNYEKFEKFLESLKRNESDDSLFESIKSGFKACFENISKSDYRPTLKQSELLNYLADNKGFHLLSWLPPPEMEPKPKSYEVMGTAVLKNNAKPNVRLHVDPDSSIRRGDAITWRTSPKINIEDIDSMK